jgi:hypothetical protein
VSPVSSDLHARSPLDGAIVDPALEPIIKIRPGIVSSNRNRDVQPAVLRSTTWPSHPFTRNIHAAYYLWMFPRSSGLLALFTVLSAGSAGFLSHAQQAQPSSPIRYQLGVDPDGKLGWTNPSFDDSSWPVAQNGLVPSRSRDADRFLWVRIHVPIPIKLNGPLALQRDDLGVQPMTWQVFVNGRVPRVSLLRPGNPRRRLARVPSELSSSTETGCPRCLAFGYLGLRKSSCLRFFGFLDSR